VTVAKSGSLYEVGNFLHVPWEGFLSHFRD